MEDELNLLQALYPEADVQRSSKSLRIVYEHAAKLGKIRMAVQVDDVAHYPQSCRPRCSVLRGLDNNSEKTLLLGLEKVIHEQDQDFCLVQLITRFIEFVDDMKPTCGICLDEIEDADVYITEVCSHVFHKSSCFRSWVEQYKETIRNQPDGETSRTRRRQRENTAEAEAKVASSKVAQTESEIAQIRSRREHLQSRITGLQGSQTSKRPTAPAAKNTIPERDKDDDDVTDVSELVRRLTIVQGSLRAKTAEFAKYKRSETDALQSWESLRKELEQEELTEAKTQMQSIPCPVCRTVVDTLKIVWS